MEFEVIRSNRKSMAVEIKLNKLIIESRIVGIPFRHTDAEESQCGFRGIIHKR